MQLKKIAFACAAALSLPLAAQAAPVTGPYDTSGMVVYLSGASGPDSYLDAVMATLLKSTAASPTYKYNVGTDFRVWLGELASSNQKIMFVKRSKGGSAFGVNPVGTFTAAAQKIATMTVIPPVGVAPNIIVPNCPAAPANAANNAFTACNASVLIGTDPNPSLGIVGTGDRPDFGVSDVVPYMFKGTGLNLEFGATALSALELAPTNLTSIGSYTIMQGFTVTKDVPETVSLNKAQYGEMLTGGIQNWSSVGLSVPATDKKTNVVVCRRTPGSGTQTTYNWYFQNYPCTTLSAESGVSGELPPKRVYDSAGAFVAYAGFTGLQDGTSEANAFPIDVTAGTGYTVIEGVGSGDVRKCLNYAAEGKEYAFKDETGAWFKVNFNQAPAGDTANKGYRAIGILSLDSQPKTAIPSITGTSTGTNTDAGYETDWYFKPVAAAGKFYSGTQTCLLGATATTPGGVPTGGTVSNGAGCPNQAALRDGSYDFSSESTFQYRTAGTGRPDVNANREAFITAFINAAGNPVNQSLWTIALPTTTNVPNGTNAVSFYSHKNSQCKPLQHN